jgi:uncharacterized protein YdeI (YjbR/CyaY-like superfamily)
MNCGVGPHMLAVLKSARAQLGKGPGDTIEVVVWKNETERTVEVPPELAKLMKKEGVQFFFDSLSYTNRKEYCRWITGAKREETRQASIAKSVEMMKNGIKTPG